MPSMTFILQGRDHLSRVLDRAGDASNRLGRRLLVTSINGDAAVRRFTNNATRNLASMERDTEAGGKALEQLGKAALLLAPAALPVAASLVPIAAGAGTVAVAVGAMTAAIIPQIGAMGEASEAQKKYEDAVAKSGARSQEAVKAEGEALAAMQALPPATREAAINYGLLKDTYKDWSDSLAGDTMAPVNKGLTIANTLIPKTTGLVKSAAGETDRFLTIIGGEMASPGFDRMNSKFSAYADKTLRRCTDELVHLLRVQDSGGGGGKTREFLDWARAQGPAVASVLQHVGEAILHILDGASDTGVSLLQIVDVLAKLASSVPAGAIAMFLQLALAIKVTKAAALGLTAAKSALIGFAIQLQAMNTAAAAAPGRLAAARAAIAALSRTARVAMAGTGIGLLLLAIGELSSRSGQAPPDVDKLTSSLKRLGSTGKVTGEAAKHFGSDLGDLHSKVAALTDPSSTDKVQQWIVSLGGLADWDSTPVKEAKENVGAIDKALAGLVSSGNADLAKAALERLTAQYGKGGRDTGAFTGKLKEYKSALADAKFEAQLAADSQGVFGAQAQAVQQKLNAQKLSAEGLRQSIQALSDTSRSAFDSQTKFEAAIDNVTKALKDNGRTLDVGSEKGRANRDALSQLASATQEAAATAVENGASWKTVSGIYERGHKALVDNATAMTGNRQEAKALAAQLLVMPTPELKLKMRTEDATRSLSSVIAAMKKAPNSKSVVVKALTKDAVSLLESLGFTVTHMKDGRFKITAATGTAKSNIAAVQKARDALKDKAIDLAARDRASAAARAIAAAIAKVRSKTVTITTVRHTAGIEGTAGRNNAKLNGYAGGGTPRPGEVAWVGENGPELMSFTGTERIFDHATSMRAIRPSTQAAGLMAGAGLAAGMTASTPTVGAAARAMAAEIETGIRDEMQIASPSKKTKALAADIGKGLIVGLTGTQAKIKSVSKDLVKDIKTAFSGRKESSLVRYVDRQTAKLLSLAKKRDALETKIAQAKDYAKGLTSTARQQSSLSALGLDDHVTVGGIKAGLNSKLAQIRQFSRYITTLAKRGLNKSLLRQVLDMGPIDGFAYASALVSADKGTFSAINKSQKALDKETTALGRKGADKLYDSGKNASKGFLQGLLSQEKSLEKTMVKLAKSMQKALRKALGIRSPARAVVPDGINTARGVAVGVLEGIPHAERAMDTLAGRMAGRAAIAPTPGRAAVVARGAGGMVVNLIVQGQIVDRLGFARASQEALLELKRQLGGLDLGIA
ncbi:hypothetical protein ABTX35_01400 [Streptomyces sp. NPDC096080]|uniref:hypothetical protein n=1 Tax=Streptomyces sp. NPDC096080 TaxID=3156693 RepID=UPI00331B94B0